MRQRHHQCTQQARLSLDSGEQWHFCHNCIMVKYRRALQHLTDTSAICSADLQWRSHLEIGNLLTFCSNKASFGTKFEDISQTAQVFLGVRCGLVWCSAGLCLYSSEILSWNAGWCLEEVLEMLHVQQEWGHALLPWLLGNAGLWSRAPL